MKNRCKCCRFQQKRRHWSYWRRTVSQSTGMSGW